MKNKIKQQVLSRLQEGEEPSEIVKEFIEEASPATIYKWIRDYTNDDLDLSEIEEEYNLDDSDLSGAEDQQSEVNTEAVGEKRKTLKRALYLFKEIEAHSDGHEWDRRQLKKTFKSLDECQNNVEALTQNDKTLYEDLAIWQYLETFVELFRDLAAAGRTISIELDDQLSYELQDALELTEFDDELTETDRFDKRFDRLIDRCSDLEGQKVNMEAIETLYNEVEALEDIIDQDEIEYSREQIKMISAVKADLTNASNRISESLWGTTTLEFSEQLTEDV